MGLPLMEDQEMFKDLAARVWQANAVVCSNIAKSINSAGQVVMLLITQERCRCCASYIDQFG